MSPCRKCEAKCCQYYALQIDTPRSKDDFENLRWYITHKRTRIFYERRKWFLEVLNKCRYLDKDHKCKIYNKRPQVCRDHEAKSCEHTLGEADHEHYFKDLKDLDKYIQNRFSRKPKKKSVKK